MAYTPTNWQTGDVVTSAKMNKLEQGVANTGGGGSVVIHFGMGEGSTMTADKTYSELAEIFESGAIIWLDLSGWADTITGEYLVTKKESIQMEAVSILAMDFVSVQNNKIVDASIAFFSNGTFDIAWQPT